MNGYQDLIVWQKAMDLVEATYRLIKLLPNDEHFVLADQMRRAAISIPSNIAESYGRNAPKEYVRYMNIARGSNCELETQFLIGIRLGYYSQEQISNAMDLCNQIGKMIWTIIEHQINSAPDHST